MNEGLGELIDEWARILIPGAYIICMSTVMCMDMDDGYKADGKAPMYSAMGNYKFKTCVAIAPILVTLGIGGWIAFRGKDAFSLKHCSKAVNTATRARHNTTNTDLQGAMGLLVELMRTHLEEEASRDPPVGAPLSMHSPGLSGAITLEDDSDTAVSAEINLKQSAAIGETQKLTALQLTVAINNPALCAESLIKAGADTSLKNEDGCTAFDYDKENNNLAAIRPLEDNATCVAEMSPFTLPLPAPPRRQRGRVAPAEAEAEKSPDVSSDTSPGMSPVDEQMKWLVGELEVQEVDASEVSP